MSQIKITPELLAEWRQKAEAAGGKQWKVYEASDGSIFITGDGEGPHLSEVWSAKDANHIAAASPAVVLALVAEVERLNFALDEILCQFDYQNNPKWRAGMKESMIDMAKKKQDMRQSSGNETNFVTKGEDNQ